MSRRVVADAGELPEVVEDSPSAAVVHANAEVQTVETWATRKDMFERFLSPSGLFSQMNPKYLLWSAARAYAAWPIGFEITEAEFDKAVAAAMNATHG